MTSCENGPMWTVIADLFSLVVDVVLGWFWRILKGEQDSV